MAKTKKLDIEATVAQLEATIRTLEDEQSSLEDSLRSSWVSNLFAKRSRP